MTLTAFFGSCEISNIADRFKVKFNISLTFNFSAYCEMVFCITSVASLIL